MEISNPNEVIEVNETPIKKENKAFKIFRRLFFILTIIFGLLTSLFYVGPIVVTFLGVAMFAIFCIFACIISILTFGIIWSSDGFISFMKGFWNVVAKTFGLYDSYDKLLPYFPYFAFSALAFTLSSLIIGIIATKKFGKKFVYIIVISSIFIILEMIFIIVYYTEGNIYA